MQIRKKNMKRITVSTNHICCTVSTLYGDLHELYIYLQGRYNALKRTHDKLEMEMTQVRLWQAETLEDHMDEDEVDGRVTLRCSMSLLQ